MDKAEKLLSSTALYGFNSAAAIIGKLLDGKPRSRQWFHDMVKRGSIKCASIRIVGTRTRAITGTEIQIIVDRLREERDESRKTRKAR